MRDDAAYYHGNPVAMREVLDELCALREAALQVEAMTREMAELRDSLSDVLELAERQWANPEELSEIRRARTLIQGDKP